MGTAGTATSIVVPESLWQRYQQAYKCAAAIIQGGGIVKIVALCLGVFLVGLALVEGIPFLILGAIGFVVNGWIIGLLCQALGQLVFAVVDTAVNTSPLLDNQRKAHLIANVTHKDVEAIFFSWLRGLLGKGVRSGESA